MQKKLTLLIGILVVGIAVLLVGVWGLDRHYQDRILPRVRVAGVEVGGKTQAEAAELLTARFGQLQPLELQWGTYRFEVSPATLQWTYDAERTAARAYTESRSVGVWQQLARVAFLTAQTLDVEPVVSASSNQVDVVVAHVVQEITIPAQEPQVSVVANGTDVQVSTGENGQAVDERLLSEAIWTHIHLLTGGIVEISVMKLEPKISEAQAEQAAALARTFLGKQLTLELASEKQQWTVAPEQIIGWIDPQTAGWRQAAIRNWAADLAKTINRPAENASLRVTGNNRVEEFKPEKQGLVVQEEQLVQDLIAALDALKNGETTLVSVKTVVTAPHITAGQINNLGIKELLGTGESWYAGSITNRIFNLKKAADALNGTLVGPGETFSFNKSVGEISQATGYKTAFIIKDGKTILGDGGGVCQTSSTLFRAILAAGLPIEERAAHAYRVSYYEQNYPPGFDATIFQPSPDFKFKNDTQAYVLIQMVFDESKKYLAFQIWGTSDGRRATVSKARVWDITSPPPDLYIDDPNQPVGKVTQTEHAAAGAKVAFDWKVVRGDEVLQERTFFTQYRPWQAVYLRGTKI